jgi:RNA polymerase sigma factor (sigma-70 family)
MTAALVLVALFVTEAVITALLWLFGVYAIVKERTCHVYVLFGRVVGIIDKPGVSLLWTKLGPAALIVNWLGKRHVLSGAGVPPMGPEETVLDQESRAEVRRALRRLPRRAATVLVLRHNGLSYAEVAEAMNVKVGHVGTMLRRAESALRKELQNAPRT